MNQVIAIVAPVFALMAFGWLAVKTGFLGKTVEQGLSAFSLWVAIPALLFRLTSEAEVPEVAPWAFWLPMLIGGVVCCL